MTFSDWFLIIVFIVAILGVGFYYLNRWATKKMTAQNEIISTMKQTQTIYVIDKKRDKIENVKMPKGVVEQMPKYNKMMKMNFVQAKIGPQITTFICDKNVYDAMPLKKNVKVEMAGIYIVSICGMKSKSEMKEIEKKKKLEAKLKIKDSKKQ